MCTPQFTAALIRSGPLGAIAADRIQDPADRPNRTGAVAQPKPEGGKFGRLVRQAREGRAIEGDEAILRRAGLTKKQARQLAKFANTRGGLDAFENIAAARRAFTESGAFTDRALQPREARQVSRVSSIAPVNQNRVGVADTIGLPLIRKRG